MAALSTARTTKSLPEAERLPQPITNRVIIERFQGLDCPLYVDAKGRLCFVLQRGESGKRVFVASSPKAGTYLLERLLTKLGAVSTEVHFSLDGIDDFRPAIVRSRTEHYLQRRVRVRFDVSPALIRPGQFGVGHIPCEPDTIAALRGFSIIFAKRELRATLISHMRMVQAPGRFNWLPQAWKALPDGPERMAGYMSVVAPKLLALQDRMSGWLRRRGVCAVAFESLLGDYGAEAQLEAAAAVATACDVPASRETIAAALGDTIGKPTRTFTGERSSIERYWNDACEEQFAALGGPALNARLGYS